MSSTRNKLYTSRGKQPRKNKKLIGSLPKNVMFACCVLRKKASPLPYSVSIEKARVLDIRGRAGVLRLRPNTKLIRREILFVFVDVFLHCSSFLHVHHTLFVALIIMVAFALALTRGQHTRSHAHACNR